MFACETVIVKQRKKKGVNLIGETIWEEEQTPVDGVLVAPADGQDATDTIRPDGVRIMYTLYFPETFTGSLRGAAITVRGRDVLVVGDPDSYKGAPTGWHMVVKAGVIHG